MSPCKNIGLIMTAEPPMRLIGTSFLKTPPHDDGERVLVPIESITVINLTGPQISNATMTNYENYILMVKCFDMAYTEEARKTMTPLDFIKVDAVAARYHSEIDYLLRMLYHDGRKVIHIDNKNRKLSIIELADPNTDRRGIFAIPRPNSEIELVDVGRQKHASIDFIYSTSKEGGDHNGK